MQQSSEVIRNDYFCNKLVIQPESDRRCGHVDGQRVSIGLLKSGSLIGDGCRIGANAVLSLWYAHEAHKKKTMNIEDYREYCLSLGEDIEEKLPFKKFKNGEGVLVFYVSGHMFSFFDCNDFSVISLKCQPERIEDLKAQHECIGHPYNESPKHWIGINPTTAPDELLKELTRNSYEIVKAKYRMKKASSLRSSSAR